MPLPRYIICSQSGSEDKETGLISLFNLIDKLHLSKTPQGVPIVEVRITAAWIREKGDEDGEFEAQIIIELPGGEEAIEFPILPFRFSAPFHRHAVRIFGPLPIMKSGNLTGIARLRRQGESEWLSKSTLRYAITVEIDQNLLEELVAIQAKK